MANTPLEELTQFQLMQAYEELNIGHAQLEAEFGEFKAKAADEKAAIEKAHADAVHKLRSQYSELEQKHLKFQALHLKNPEIFLAQYTHVERLGLYTSKEHPEWGYFCGVCLPKGVAAQVRTCSNGWKCEGCGHYIEDPNNPMHVAPNPRRQSVFRP